MVSGLIRRLAVFSIRFSPKLDFFRSQNTVVEMSSASTNAQEENGSSEQGKRAIEDVTDAGAGNDTKKLKTDTEREAGAPFRKKKVALLMSYCGKGYAGMQRNPGQVTIESVLMEALVKSGVIRQDHAENPGEKMRFQRAARTDKGVSAAGQVCSLKMFIDVENPVEKINSHLPPEMCIQSIKRTTQGFDCKQAAAARTYLYMLPTFAFAPIDQNVAETYRITEDVLQQINDVLKLFLGTHNFHNFTSGRKPTDQSARRYIMKFSIGQPFMRDGLEFAVIRVKGQSFILHQIRKMIGLTIAMVRGFTTTEVLDKCWGPERVDVPVAPGLGLVLDRLHYDYYNKKFGSTHDPLEWDDIKEQIEEFTEKHIYKTIIETEVKEKSMMKWLTTLPLHKYDIIVEGEPRHSPFGRANNQLIVKHQQEEKEQADKLQSDNTQDVSKAEDKTDQLQRLEDDKQAPEMSTDTSDAVNVEKVVVDCENGQTESSVDQGSDLKVNDNGEVKDT